MEMLYNSKGLETYLDVDMGDASVGNTFGIEYKIKMIQENEISYLLKPIYMELDGRLSLKYNTNSFYVIERLFSYVRPDGELLKIILSQICELIREVEKYLLVPNEIVIEPSYMFYDGERKELKLIYIPGYNKNIAVQLKDFLEFVMKIFDHRDKEGMTFMYQIYDLITRQSFSLDNIEKCLLVCRTVPIIQDETSVKEFTWHEPVIAINAIAMIFFIAKYFAFGKHETDIIIGIFLFVAMIIHGLFYVGNDEFDAGRDMERQIEKNDDLVKQGGIIKVDYVENKEIFNDNEVGKLVPLTNGALKVISLEGQGVEVVIGRGKKDSNYRLPTTQISRVHACIYKNKEGVFIEDRASTNGTFINSNRITAYERVKINRGDIISFANEEFFAS